MEALAILSPKDIHQRQKELAGAWEQYVSNRTIATKLRLTIVESWKRSSQLGVRPQQKKAKFISPLEETIEWRNQSEFFAMAIPILEHMTEQVSNTYHLLTLTDANGRIIYLNGDRSILKKAEKMAFTLGADWSEASVGTNAIGTALHIKEALQVFSYEHFAQGAHDWVCSAAPVKDPLTGDILGIIDLTAPYEYAQPHTLSTAQMISVSIQKEYLRLSNAYRAHIIEVFLKAKRRWPKETIWVLDKSFQLITFNQNAQDIMHEKYNPLPFKQIQQRLLELYLEDPQEEKSIKLKEFQIELLVKSIVMKNERIGYLILIRKMEGSLYQDFQLDRNHREKPWSNIIGHSPQIKDIISRAQTVASTDVPVLLTGESGSGKELFARAIHETSTRRHKPFIAVNIASIPKELIASELFGYAPYAFTGAHHRGKKGKFEEAQGGTIFLDEIGDMPLDVQVYLLRVLQEKEIVRLGASQNISIDVRVVAATHQKLTELVEKGFFRLDLFYRLNVVELALPPLRERDSDLMELAYYFLERFSQQYGKPIHDFSVDVKQFFQSYPWPGNIRELQNTIEHAVIFSANHIIEIQDLPEHLKSAIEKKKHVQNTQMSDPLLDPLQLEEKRLLQYWIQKTAGNISEVARQLNRSRATIYRKIKQYGLAHSD
ncbi:MAG: Response regulator of zinc sigma-54-dependent two-component system [Candidatus Carbobacillus altaicus]|uniref:Response regulator of zinc sigma-54-dependent two-component system n=1 Tax=Candidatus Carbonibacillus altaicus TaxID=2163959 RepID=A0A2R6Y4R5_9BACL|nr:MAG: Response regulator of zinc sigma-54-dependent two-component system [Candidatus Carbobacillus altaicus]